MDETEQRVCVALLAHIKIFTKRSFFVLVGMGPGERLGSK